MMKILIFSAAYLMSAVLQRQGFSPAAGLLMLGAAVFLYVEEYRKTGRLLNFRGLFALGLIGGEGVSQFRLSHLSTDWTLDTWLSFYFAFLVFYLAEEAGERIMGSWCSRQKRSSATGADGLRTETGLPQEKDALLRTATDDAKTETCLQQKTEGPDGRILIAALLLVAYGAFFFELSRLRFVPLLIRDTPHAYSTFHLPGVHYFTTLFVLVPALVLLRFERRGAISLQGIGALFLAFLLPVLLVSRFQFMFAAILALFARQVLRENAPGQGKKPIRLWQILLTAAAMTAVYIVLTVARAHSVEYLNGIFDMKNRATPIFITQPYMYIANNYDNFNRMTQELQVHSHGYRQLYPFVTLTGLKFLVDIPMSYPLYITKEELTTLTILYDAWYDFGIPGVLLFSGLLGVVAGGISLYTVEHPSPGWVLLYAEMAFYLLFSFFTTWFSNAATWFYLGWTVLLILGEGILHRRRGSFP